MLLTVFLAIVFCAAISLMLLSAVAFIQDKKFFASAPKEAQKVLFTERKRIVLWCQSDRLDTDAIEGTLWDHDDPLDHALIRRKAFCLVLPRDIQYQLFIRSSPLVLFAN